MDKPEIKPCPNPACRGTHIIVPQVCRVIQRYWLRCADCGVCGPDSATEREATEGWNALGQGEALAALEMALDVMPALPKVPGYELRVEARKQLAEAIAKLKGESNATGQ